MISGPGSLEQPFVQAAPQPLRAALQAVPDLGARLWTLVQEGRAAWPTVTVEPIALAAFIARQLDETVEPGEALEGLRGGDLWLACACAGGNTAAIELFDRNFIREVDIALARMRIGPPRSHDVKQLVRQRLFVGADGKSGKISEYAGRGDLRRWVRAVAVRTCLNDLRKGKHEVLTNDDQLIAQHTIPTDDPEIEYMKRTYAAEFRAAFGEALTRLGPREQTLLRYHHVDGLNIDEIGAIYRVHRVTAFRWLERAREQLVAATLELLRGRLKVTPAELDSVLRMIRSQVHLSLVRHLGGRNDVGASEADAEAEIEELDGEHLVEADS